MKPNTICYFGLALLLGSSAMVRAEGETPYKYADCEFTESYDDTAYKCAASIQTCIFNRDSDDDYCTPDLSIFCDEGDMFQGRWKEGSYGNYLRIQGKMREDMRYHSRSVIGPIIDILKNSSKGYPAQLQLYGKTLSGYCSMYSPSDAPVPGTTNP